MNERAELRAKKEREWRALSVAERIRRTVAEQRVIERSAILGVGARILEKRSVEKDKR